MAATIASSAQSIMRPLAAALRGTLPRSWAIATASLLVAISLLLSDRQASAADLPPAMRPWVVQDLKGAASSRAHDADDSQWRALQAGAPITPGSVVRTDGSGRLELTNGIDHISLSPNSELELPAGRSGDPVTRVIHWIGTAFFQVGKRPGPQFEVDTPYIVAIVKGTKFTTAVSDAGASIKVREGIVGVSPTAGGSSIDVTAGGSASVSAAHGDTVVPGGPSGEVAPAGNRGKGSALARSRRDRPADEKVEAGAVSSAGGALSGGADATAAASRGATGQSGHGGGNGNGRGRDQPANDGNSAVIGNGGGQGGVDSGDDDGHHGGGCHDLGDHHRHGDDRGDRDHGDHDHGSHGH